MATNNGTDTDLDHIMDTLDGSLVREKIQRLLSVVSANVVDNKAPGKIQLTIDLKKIGSENTYMVEALVTLMYKHPTLRGEKSEKDISSTPYHVNNGGRLTFAPDTQTGMKFNLETGEINEPD